MSNYRPAPITEPVIEQSTLLAKGSWTLFFNGLYTGDTGTIWTPIATNLTQVGVATITGAYYRSGQFIDFYIKIVPGTSTSSTAGSTYFDLPFDVLQDGACEASTGLTSSPGGLQASTNRVYPPNWAATGNTITISGRVLGR